MDKSPFTPLQPKQTNACPGTREQRFDSAAARCKQTESFIDWRFHVMEGDSQPKGVGSQSGLLDKVNGRVVCGEVALPL